MSLFGSNRAHSFFCYVELGMHEHHTSLVTFVDG